MPNLKRVMVCIPPCLLEEVDCLVQDQDGNRSRLVRDALRYYLRHQKSREIRVRMRVGYQEMASINRELADEDLSSTSILLEQYEVKLSKL